MVEFLRWMQTILLVVAMLFSTQIVLAFPFSSANKNEQPSEQTSFVDSLEQRVVDFVHKSISTLRYSSYKLGGTHIDTDKGIYVVDCSTYVDHVLQEVYPEAYSSLVDYTGSEKPTSRHFYNFFTDLSYEPNDYWNKIDDVEELRAGDILVFRNKHARRQTTSGHVMVVMDKPIREENSFLVKVADSAPSGHSEDTRQSHTSGIGIGTLLLKMNPKTHQPSAYAWKVGSCWKKNVTFAMGRPVETSN